MGFLTLPQGCARAWAEPPPSLWTAAKVPQHPAGSCFSRDCRMLIGFSARVPGAQPEPGKPPGPGPRPGSEPRQPTPSSTGWDPRGFPSNRVPRRARGGTLAAFRPTRAPAQGWQAVVAEDPARGGGEGERAAGSFPSLPRRRPVKGQWSCAKPSRVQSGSASEAPAWRGCGVRRRLSLRVRDNPHGNVQLAGRGACSLIFPDLCSSPAPSWPWVGGRSF